MPHLVVGGGGGVTFGIELIFDRIVHYSVLGSVHKVEDSSY